MLTADELKIMRKPAEKPMTIGDKPNLVGEISLMPCWQGNIRERHWLWFPLTINPDLAFAKIKFDWLKTYPRIIKHGDEHYVYVGMQSESKEVYYKQILREQGESIDYVTNL